MLGTQGTSRAQPVSADGAASQSVATPAQQPLPSPGAAADGAQNIGRLSIATNAACELRIGGAPQIPVLMPDAPRSVMVPPGETVIECASTTVREAALKKVVAIAAGGNQDIALDVAALVVAASCAGKPATLADLGNGTLRHCVTRLDWTESDSGSGGMIWDDARAWCAKKGAGWRLPTPDELAELIDRSGRSQTACNKHTCNVSPRFKLTSPLVWSNQVTGPGMAMLVNLMLGGRHPTGQESNFDYHALCLRHSSEKENQ